MNLSCDPSIALLGIYPIELKSYFCTKIYTPVFIVAVFVIDPNLDIS